METGYIFSLVLFFLFACNEAYPCNPRWLSYYGNCYRWVDTTADIRLARRYCELLNGDLAYVAYNFTFLLLEDVSNEYWIREDSEKVNLQNPTEIPDGPTWGPNDCRYLSRLKVEYGDCNHKRRFLCETAQLDSDLDCPEGWFLYDSICYSLTSQTNSFNITASMCSNVGEPAILDNSTKEQSAEAVIIGEDEIFFVGAERKDEGFRWLNGKPFSPTCSTCTNFTSDGDCLGIKSSSSHPTMFQWISVNCDAQHQLLCQMKAFPPTAVPTSEVTTSLSSTVRTLPLFCPMGYNWKAYPDSSYCFWETTYETDRLNWYQARQFCQAYGGDLATYQDSLEENHGLGGAKGHYKGLWFGLKRGEDDIFRWVDGTNLNYTNWEFNEPNLKSKSKYCASHSAGNGRWELDYCGVRRWFVCKAPKVLTPTLPDTTFKKTTCNFTSSTFHNRWYLYNNYCYLINDNPKYSWDLAQNFCKDNEAHLASVHSFNETDFILLMSNKISNTDYWIGLSAKGLGSSFTWSDGTPLSFLYWFDDHVRTETEINRCVTFDQQRGFWKSSHCNRLLGVICKRGVNSSYEFPTPEPTPVLPGNCEQGWYLLGNQCYKVFGQKWSQREKWRDAKFRCENESATLASIHNEEQQNFLTDLMFEVETGTWIGMENLNMGTVFKWVDNSALDYVNWDVDEPSNSDDDEDSGIQLHSAVSCVNLNYDKNSMGKWNDKSCQLQKAYICQKPKDPRITIPSEDPFTCTFRTGWSRLGTSCFGIFENEKLTWTKAQSKCRSFDANLVSFQHSATAEFLKKRLTKKTNFLWTGIRETEKNKFSSVQGKSLTYDNWLASQPKMVSTFMDNCVAMNSETKWMVKSCQEKQAFVCELNSASDNGLVNDESHLCPAVSGWRDIGGDLCVKYTISTYYFSYSWDRAMQYCFKHGGSLATFHSEKDLKLFLEYVRENFHLTSIHIGLGKRKDGSYIWADYSPVDFTAFDPDDPPSTTKDCVELDIKSGKWKRSDCGIERSFFCTATKHRDSVVAENFSKEDDIVSKKLAIGGIFGIVICLLVLAVIIGITAYYLCPVRKMRSKLLRPDTSYIHSKSGDEDL